MNYGWKAAFLIEILYKVLKETEVECRRSTMYYRYFGRRTQRKMKCLIQFIKIFIIYYLALEPMLIDFSYFDTYSFFYGWESHARCVPVFCRGFWE